MATQGVQMKLQGVQNVTFDENPHENERIVVILGCANSITACAKHRCTGGWLKLCHDTICVVTSDISCCHKSNVQQQLAPWELTVFSERSFIVPTSLVFTEWVNSNVSFSKGQGWFRLTRLYIFDDQYCEQSPSWNFLKPGRILPFFEQGFINT